MSVISATKHLVRHDERRPIDLGFFHIVWLFLLCSFVGLVGETLVSFVVDGRWESRAGYVFGPLSPLYGLGAVLITIGVNPLRGRNPVLQFVSAGVIGGSLEYLAGWFFEIRYGIVAWSYADVPLNFEGHTCVAMMALWGAVGVGWVNWALPAAVKLIERIPESARRPLTAAAFAFVMADSALTLVCLDSWFWRAAGYPASNPVQEFCAAYFGDEFMRSRFETMGMWTSLASR